MPPESLEHCSLVLAVFVVAASGLTLLGHTILVFIAQFGIGLFFGKQFWIRTLVSPAVVLAVAAGVVAASVMRHHPSKASYFVWVIPCVFFVRALREVVNAPYATRSEVWNTMFGADCRGSECLYEAFFTVPFVCAISYSVSGAIIRVLRQTRSLAAKSNDVDL